MDSITEKLSKHLNQLQHLNFEIHKNDNEATTATLDIDKLQSQLFVTEQEIEQGIRAAFLAGDEVVLPRCRLLLEQNKKLWGEFNSGLRIHFKDKRMIVSPSDVDRYKEIVSNSINNLINEIEKYATPIPLQKIKWLGSPEQFGYIFGELASKGYIELPSKNGEGVFSKLAELSLMYFELTTTKGKNVGKQTTPENLERALNPETNQLSIKGKANLKLPPIKDLK